MPSPYPLKAITAAPDSHLHSIIWTGQIRSIPEMTQLSSISTARLPPATTDHFRHRKG